MKEIFTVVSCQETPNKNSNVLVLNPEECKWWTATVVNIKDTAPTQFSDHVHKIHNEAFEKSKHVVPKVPKKKELFEKEELETAICKRLKKDLQNQHGYSESAYGEGYHTEEGVLALTASGLEDIYEYDNKTTDGRKSKFLSKKKCGHDQKSPGKSKCGHRADKSKGKEDEDHDDLQAEDKDTYAFRKEQRLKAHKTCGHRRDKDEFNANEKLHTEFNDQRLKQQKRCGYKEDQSKNKEEDIHKTNQQFKCKETTAHIENQNAKIREINIRKDELKDKKICPPKEVKKVPAILTESLILVGNVPHPTVGLKMNTDQKSPCTCKPQVPCDSINEFMHSLDHKVTFYPGYPNVQNMKPKMFFSSPDISITTKEIPKTKNDNCKACQVKNLKESSQLNYEKYSKEIEFPKLSKFKQDVKTKGSITKRSLPHLLEAKEDDQNLQKVLTTIKSLKPRSSSLKPIPPGVVKYFRPLVDIAFPVDVENLTKLRSKEK